MSWVEETKRRAALEAVKEVRSGFVVGLGSGSTAAYAIQALGEALRSGVLQDVMGVPTSYQAASVALEAGLPLTTLDENPRLDVAIDGADQVDASLNLIKGGGGALTREKVVASAADRYVVVVDEGKLVEVLGVGQVVPVEVLPFASAFVLRRVGERARSVHLRVGSGKVGPVVTDNGNFLLDADFGPIEEAGELEAWLRSIPGVVETGLFLGLADIVYVGTRKGVRRLVK
ncbi:ribose-5-phosphate isomerase RpiA [Candidatus Bathyarchaeota archaeon]|nr:MAG: ribose-5-phosphate isomerase RpiA [Candidatus Bathyarchaeota archaeon]